MGTTIITNNTDVDSFKAIILLLQQMINGQEELERLAKEQVEATKEITD